MAESKKNIELNIGMPAVAGDGHAIAIDKSTGTVSLVIFQISGKSDGKVQANAVANIRTGTKGLAKLRDAITEVLEKHEKETKKK